MRGRDAGSATYMEAKFWNVRALYHIGCVVRSLGVRVVMTFSIVGCKC